MRADAGTPTEIVDKAIDTGELRAELRELAIVALEVQPSWCGCMPVVVFCGGDEDHEAHVRGVLHEGRCKVSLILRAGLN